MISKYAFHINVVYYNLSFLIMVSFFFLGTNIGGPDPEIRKLGCEG